jgi:threonine synthase
MELRINPYLDRLVCSLSGQTVPHQEFRRPVGLCPCCPPPGKPVEAVYRLDALRDDRAGDWQGPRIAEGLWRHAALLPVWGVDDAYAADVGRPVFVRPAPLADELSLDLHLMNEGGHPSGSFKDRGLAVGIALGAACGARRFCLPTQGNAGVAACLFSSRLGLPGCLVYMPERWRGSIYHRECAFFGGEVRFHGAHIAAAGRRMREDLRDELAAGALVDISTFYEPGRLEGKKTMGLDIAARFGPRALPEVIIYPTGGGTGLVGIWKAFAELAELDRLPAARMPAMVAVQSEGCAPVVEAFRRGLAAVEPVVSRGTVADGLDVPGAIMGHRMLGVLRDSGGTAVAVNEAEIVAAFRRYGALGVAASYEGAAALAAARRLRAEGFVKAGARVLLVNTASHFVALAREAPPPPGPAAQVECG